jgi:hypothetical protein
MALSSSKIESKKKKEASLTPALSFLLNKTLLPDLQERSKMRSVRAALARQYSIEKAENRTADTLDSWINRTLEQVAARSQKRRSLFDAQDEVDRQRELLIQNIEAKLAQKTSTEVVFSLRWTLT